MDSPNTGAVLPRVEPTGVTREKLLHALYEAAELEHNLMCTYLYAAASLRDGTGEGLAISEAEAVARWRQAILDVAIDEMGHLVAVWNITAALGGTPRFGRANFPLDPGMLPAGIVVRLAPFDPAVLQHFIHLERPAGSSEPDGEGFGSDWTFTRAVSAARITPMPIDYETVGAFYAELGDGLRRFVEHIGESAAFCGDPDLQLSAHELKLPGAEPVICSKTALARFSDIIAQGEGAPSDSAASHFQSFCAIRAEYDALRHANPQFRPAFPAAVNPVLRRPVRPTGRVWIENEDAAAIADVANASYGTMLRLLAYSYQVPRPAPEKALAVDLALELMHAFAPLSEQVARMPAGASNPRCHAGVSFVTLRDPAPLPVGSGARRYFRERIAELAAAAAALDASGKPRLANATRRLTESARKAARGFFSADVAAPSAPATAVPVVGASAAAPAPAPSKSIDGVEIAEGKAIDLHFEARRCIHARFCVTGAPNVFLANVKGPWLHPDAMDAEALVAIAHACPSGAIRYRRKDGRPEESAPPVNLVTVREAGPYAVRAAIVLDGHEEPFRATLCRCGASKNKPYCDGSHHEVGFSATGEPPTQSADMLIRRDGALSIDPELDGPLRVRGNLEIVSGTGRVIARLTQARLCRCGGSATKPFCDGTHAKIGFRST